MLFPGILLKGLTFEVTWGSFMCGCNLYANSPVMLFSGMLLRLFLRGRITLGAGLLT